MDVLPSFHRARSASKKNGLLLPRIILRPRVARAQKIIRLHPLLCSGSKGSARMSFHPFHCGRSASTEAIPVASPSPSDTVRFVKNFDSLAEEGTDLLKEQRDGTTLRDFGDERFRVFLQKPFDSGECFHKDLSHFLALQISRGQAKRRHARPHKRKPFDVSVPDAMVFGQDDPPALSGFSKPVFVLGIGREVVVVDVEGCTGLAERDSDALLSEGPIEEEDWSFRRLRRRVRT